VALTYYLPVVQGSRLWMPRYSWGVPPPSRSGESHRWRRHQHPSALTSLSLQSHSSLPVRYTRIRWSSLFLSSPQDQNMPEIQEAISLVYFYMLKECKILRFSHLSNSHQLEESSPQQVRTRTYCGWWGCVKTSWVSFYGDDRPRSDHDNRHRSLRSVE
jgi:hypothetical protein